MLKAVITDGNIKMIMNELLLGKGFDKLEMRSCEITTNVSYKIDGIINKQWYETPYENGASYIKWADIKPTVFNIIKGKKSPKTMKLVFSMSRENMEELHSNAAACFLNLAYENDTASVITATMQKQFALDKSLDMVWDDSVRKFLGRICQYTE